MPNPATFETTAPFDILIVDDSNALLTHVLQALDLPNYRCRVARTAVAAIKEVQTRIPDLLLLDCQLDAKRRGSEVLQASPNPSVPVTIVFSASNEEADQMYDRFEQVAARLTKPFGDAELQSTVREAIEQNIETIAAMRKFFAEQPSAAEEGTVPPPAVDHDESQGAEEETAVQESLVIAEAPDEAAETDLLEQMARAPHAFGPEPTYGEQPSLLALAVPNEDLLLEAFLGHPDLRRAMASALRSVMGTAEPALMCGRPPVVTGSALLQWSVRQSQFISIVMRDHEEVIQIFVAGMRVVGVASDSYVGALRGIPRPPKVDLDGALQQAAAVRLCVSQTGYFEAREIDAPPAWCISQSPAATERLAMLGAG